MPNQPATPARNFRIPDEVWLPARERARTEGVSITDVVVAALAEWAHVEVPDKNRGGRPANQ